jgi:hypothetical protein
MIKKLNFSLIILIWSLNSFGFEPPKSLSESSFGPSFVKGGVWQLKYDNFLNLFNKPGQKKLTGINNPLTQLNNGTKFGNTLDPDSLIQLNITLDNLYDYVQGEFDFAANIESCDFAKGQSCSVNVELIDVFYSNDEEKKRFIQRVEFEKRMQSKMPELDLATDDDYRALIFSRECSIKNVTQASDLIEPVYSALPVTGNPANFTFFKSHNKIAKVVLDKVNECLLNQVLMFSSLRKTVLGNIGQN